MVDETTTTPVSEQEMETSNSTFSTITGSNQQGEAVDTDGKDDKSLDWSKLQLIKKKLISTPHLKVLVKIANQNLNNLQDTGEDLRQNMHHHLKCNIIQNNDLQLAVVNGRNDNVQGWKTILYDIEGTTY